jgi:hypothetical protein
MPYLHEGWPRGKVLETKKRTQKIKKFAQNYLVVL